MSNSSNLRARQRSLCVVLLLLLLVSVAPSSVRAHPLGNFTVNHYSRLEVGGARISVRYVVDMAEISAFQELQEVDTDADGKTTDEELDAYARRIISQYAENLILTVDGARVPLSVSSQRIMLPPGEGGLPTLRIESDLAGVWPAGNAGAARRLQFKDANHTGRLGWHEIVIAPAGGTSVFNSSAYGNELTHELRAYPADMLAAPLNERTAELSFTTGAVMTTAQPLRMRDGRPVAATARDRFAELINVPELTPGVALVGLLFAAMLGGFHALSPGHGKAVVAAYLVGSRGTAKHAAFLGLTVTITHTAGVIALGLVTLFATQYVVPEKLFPLLTLVSGAIVVVMGLSLFVRRLAAALGLAAPEHQHHHDAHGHTHEHVHEEHAHGHTHEDSHAHDEVHEPEHTHGGAHVHSHGAHKHSHGGREHSHLPPGTDGTPITWRSLLALGVSGGLLPCPSALVVMLSAITLGRVGYGLILVLAFSVGLASVLTGIGMMFIYARRFIERPLASANWLMRVLPVFSALVITLVGVAICYQALNEGGYEALTALGNSFAHDEETIFASKGALAILGFGLLFGLKHATEADHVVAVSTIVSEHRKLWRSALVGALWGAGHTASLILVGAVVLVLRIAIPERIAEWLEFSVALMIILLGVLAVLRSLRGRAAVHVHRHRHDGQAHAHVHFHEPENAHAIASTEPHTHAVSRIGIKPLIVGAIHGLAGSAALTLLVLTQIESVFLGLLYLAVFGLGSIAGMILMSGLIGLPFAYSAGKFAGFHRGLQAVAGVLSIAFGLWYAYEKGIASGLLTAAM